MSGQLTTAGADVAGSSLEASMGQEMYQQAQLHGPIQVVGDG